MSKPVLGTTTRAGWIYVAAGLASAHTETTASVAVVPNLTIHPERSSKVIHIRSLKLIH